MFEFLKNKNKKHTHEFNEEIGKYYVLWRTEYKNDFDIVKIFLRKKCSCGCYKDFFIGRKTFLPSMHKDDSEEKEFIKEIKAKGIEEEYEINIKTNMCLNEKKCSCV